LVGSLRRGASTLGALLGSRLSTTRAKTPLEALTDESLASDERPIPLRRPELDFRTVELREASGHWPAGTRGVIVDAYEDDAIVEIADHDGVTLDLLTLPYDDLDLFEGDAQETFPAASLESTELPS
jgi:hypothetical protein